MKCVFICSGEYPDNQAAAIRNTLYARGVAEQGLPVEIWLLTPQPWETLPPNRSHGLSFVKLNGLRNGARWQRALYKCATIVRATAKMLVLSLAWRRNRNIAAVMYCTELAFLAPMVTVAKAFGLPLIHERTEFPYVVAKNSALGRLSLRLYLRYVLPAFDTVMVINDELGRYISRYNPNIVKVNTIVDEEEFRPTAKAVFSFPYVAYCGTMYGQKDGLDILVRAFSIAVQNYPDWKLVLVGDNSRPLELAPLIELIEQLGLADKVIFTGRIDRQDVPIVLRSAKVLALAKPANEQNAGNFPIKLGEYLATGVPVLVTNVGEIPKFVQDGVTGYLSFPDVKSFSERLLHVIGNQKEAIEVGKRGSDLAGRLFSYHRQSQVLLDAINGVVTRK